MSDIERRFTPCPRPEMYERGECCGKCPEGWGDVPFDPQTHQQAVYQIEDMLPDDIGWWRIIRSVRPRSNAAIAKAVNEHVAQVICAAAAGPFAVNSLPRLTRNQEDV